MANNGDLGFDGPSPDYVPDENADQTETVGEAGDLDPMVFLSKLEKVQEHFDQADVRCPVYAWSNGDQGNKS